MPVPDYLKDQGSFISDALQGAKNVGKRIFGFASKESAVLDHVNRQLRLVAEMPFRDANEAMNSLAPFARILGGEEGLNRFLEGTKEVGDQGPTLDGLIKGKQNELKTAMLFAQHSAGEVDKSPEDSICP